MKPTAFEHSNQILQPSGEQLQKYSENVVITVAPLPVWTNGEQCVSCWRMSLRERLSALLFGRVWLALLSGETQPPVLIQVGRKYLR